jgi:hypothetical protein
VSVSGQRDGAFKQGNPSRTLTFPKSPASSALYAFFTIAAFVHSVVRLPANSSHSDQVNLASGHEPESVTVIQSHLLLVTSDPCLSERHKFKIGKAPGSKTDLDGVLEKKRATRRRQIVKGCFGHRYICFRSQLLTYF